MSLPRLSIDELRLICGKRGLSTAGCLERSDLEALLAETPATRSSGRSRVAPQRRSVADDDDSDNEPLALLGLRSCAGGSVSSTSRRRPPAKKVTEAPPEDARSEEQLGGESEEDSMEYGLASEKDGWAETEESRTFRRGKEHFHVYTLRRPFGNATWMIQVRVAQGSDKQKQSGQSKRGGSSQPAPKREEVRELLKRMALDLGAVNPAAGGSESLGEQEKQVLQRLQRLEERFRGSGVTEGEARNAVRLFERELSKANWTEDKFAKLKRQLAGTEEWSAADAVAETSVRWVQRGKRRQAWFADACERVATPLGIEFGYTGNGGCCFVGPLSACVGAALTTTLVCHLAHLDLESASHKRRTRISAPQFLQGFVDGALAKERHLVWEKLFSIEDEAAAARFCQENLHEGFFDDLAGEEGRGEEEDLQAMLRNLFAAQGGNPCSSPRSLHPGRPVHPDEQVPARSDAEVPKPPAFTPFSGKAHRLGEAEEPSAEKPSQGSNSWALTFASNLELARCSRRRSRDEAKRTYHWTFSGHAVKETKTGTESYSQGRNAGEKRKGQIDGAAGSAKSKFRKGPQLAITR
eukprot:TRINITY_DN27961_c0_g1_i1.p1 TRINITY_DN27961_c0_g1~~TRINITY_DN27961_c0_g1_i1.p1  ORF type:complete len:595 (-),score=137.11 TRINITY_DN27961_c0_g1_i1:13-1755(-)